MSGDTLPSPTEVLYLNGAQKFRRKSDTAKDIASSTLISVPSHEDAAADKEPDEDLLDHLSKIDLTYRDIQFTVPQKAGHVPETRRNYQKRVSFDTVNVDFYDHWDAADYTNDYADGGYGGYSRKSSIEDYDFTLGVSRGRPRQRLSPNPSPLQSPSTSPIRGSNEIMDMNRILASKKHFRTDYPTSPIITHKGCTFTKVHRSFEDLYDDKLNCKDHGFLRPVLPNRTILVYISGRKHTWVALDWVLNKLIEHGDTVVIISAINKDYPVRRRSFSSFSSPNIIVKTSKMRLRMRHQPHYVKTIADDIMNYAMEVIRPHVIAKVSIELAVGKTKDVLKEMYKLYEPNLVCTGAKPNVHISAPLRSWTSSKLSDRLVKNFPLPVIFTPAVNMGTFENRLKNRIEARYQTSTRRYSDTSTVSRLPTDDGEETKSLSSMSSEESYSSYDELTSLYYDYKKDLRVGLSKSVSGGYTESFFTDALKLISDKSAKMCRDFRAVDPDFRGRGAKLARLITGSNSFGIVPYKTKSLLAPIEKEASRGDSVSNVPKVSLKDMKRALKARQEEKEKEQLFHAQTSPPSISVHPPHKSPSLSPGSSPPPRSSLKFVNLEVPNKENIIRDMGRLHKSFSHTEDEKSSRPSLMPSKSQPMFTTSHLGTKAEPNSDKKPKSKKKKNFFKLFGV